MGRFILVRNGLLGALTAVVMIELVLQLLPVTTATRMGYYIDPWNRTYPPGASLRTSNGWDLRAPQEHRINSNGLASPRERDSRKPGLGVIGDSYVEGTAVEPAHRISAQLQDRMLSVDVQMLGVPGTSLIDFADRATWARNTLHIDQFIFAISRNDAEEAVCGSTQHLRRCVNATQLTLIEQPIGARSRLANVLSYSATLQYFLGHLKASAAALHPSRWRPTPAPPEQNAAPRPLSPAATVAVDLFVARLRELTNARVMLVYDCDRTALYAGKPLAPAPLYTALESRLANSSVVRLDTCDAFRTRFARDGLRTEVSLQDAHWNARGHGIMAEVIAQAWTHYFPSSQTP